jgi:hypothetical protein
MVWKYARNPHNLFARKNSFVQSNLLADVLRFRRHLQGLNNTKYTLPYLHDGDDSQKKVRLVSSILPSLPPAWEAAIDGTEVQQEEQQA